jgi:hypothetical protein
MCIEAERNHWISGNRNASNARYPWPQLWLHLNASLNVIPCKMLVKGRNMRSPAWNKSHHRTPDFWLEFVSDFCSLCWSWKQQPLLENNLVSGQIIQHRELQSAVMLFILCICLVTLLIYTSCFIHALWKLNTDIYYSCSNFWSN